MIGREFLVSADSTEKTLSWKGVLSPLVSGKNWGRGGSRERRLCIRTGQEDKRNIWDLSSE